MTRYTYDTFTTEEYGDLISQYDGADTLYHQYDGLGSTDALLDEWETATDRYAHRTFGLEAARSGTTDNPFTYVGRQSYYKDPELELYLLGARYYDPQAGRFLSEDPLRYQSDNLNLYAYVHNNPVNATDPSGTERRPPTTATNGSAASIDGDRSDGYDAKLAAAKRVAQRVPDFEEFNSYEAWKAAAALARLDAVESATKSPEFGMTPVEVRTKNLHPNSRCSQQVPPARKSSAMLRT